METDRVAVAYTKQSAYESACNLTEICIRLEINAGGRENELICSPLGTVPQDHVVARAARYKRPSSFSFRR